MKTCTKCNVSKNLSEFRIRTKKSKTSDKRYEYISSHCTECEKAERAANRTKEYRNQYKIKKREQNPVLYHMQERISQWKRKDLNSDLTVEYLVDLWEQQKGLCYYTHQPMILGGTRDTLWNNASLDKLNPELGYVQGNLVWCTYKVNSMKGPMTYDEFIELCIVIGKCKL